MDRSGSYVGRDGVGRSGSYVGRDKVGRSDSYVGRYGVDGQAALEAETAWAGQAVM